MATQSTSTEGIGEQQAARSSGLGAGANLDRSCSFEVVRLEP